MTVRTAQNYVNLFVFYFATPNDKIISNEQIILCAVELKKNFF